MKNMIVFIIYMYWPHRLYLEHIKNMYPSEESGIKIVKNILELDDKTIHEKREKNPDDKKHLHDTLTKLNIQNFGEFKISYNKEIEIFLKIKSGRFTKNMVGYIVIDVSTNKKEEDFSDLYIYTITVLKRD